MSITTAASTAQFPIPPFGNPDVASVATQVANSIGVSGGLAQYLNVALGEAVNSNAIYITFAGGALQALPAIDHGALVNAAAGAISVVAAPIGTIGRLFEVVKTDSSANQVTVTLPAGTTFADGSTTFVLYSQNDYVDILANAITGFYHVRGSRQRSASNVGGFAGLAGPAAVSMNGAGQASQTVTSPTPVVFPVILFDEGLPNPYTIATSTLSFFTAPQTGKYLLNAQVPVSATLTSTIGGYVFMTFKINASTYTLGVTEAFVSATSTVTTLTGAIALSGIVSLTSGNTVAVSLLNQGLANLQTVTTGGGGLGALGQFSILQVG